MAGISCGLVVRHVVVGVFLAVVFAYASPPRAAEPAPVPSGPWKDAQAVLAATLADAQKRGFQGIQPHVADMEAALGQRDQAYAAARAGTKDTIYVLTNGLGETMAGLLEAARQKIPSAGQRRIEAIENPYPAISFYLGGYYNEFHRPADALRVLDIGLGLPPPVPGMANPMRNHLLSERATTLIAFKRFDEALAAYDEGLAIVPLAPLDRAHLLRGRGFVLTELGRLDEAEKCYRDSLALEPNNMRAQNELTYITKRRNGAAAEATAQAVAGPTDEVQRNSVYLYTQANYARMLVQVRNCQAVDAAFYALVNQHFDQTRSSLVARFGEAYYPTALPAVTPGPPVACSRSMIVGYNNSITQIDTFLANAK